MEEAEERRREEDSDNSNEEEEAAVERVYVAVGRQVKENRANLIWALQNLQLSNKKKLVIAYVHKPASTINIMGAQFPVSQLAEQEVTAYRLLEKSKLEKVLKEYMDVCLSHKVEAEQVIIENDDTAQGIVELIRENGITELVMGAAGDRRYSRRLKTLKSRKALLVEQKAELRCKILFVCRGNLICTREASEGTITPRAASSSSSSPSPRHNSIPYNIPIPSASSFIIHSASFPPNSNSIIRSYAGGDTQWAHGTLQEKTTGGYMSEKLRVSCVYDEGPSTVAQDTEEECQTESSSAHNGSADDISIEDIDLYERLRGAITEAEDLKNEAYEAARRRQKAEKDLLEASRKAKAAESLYHQELRKRRDIEEKISKEELEMEQERQQLDNIIAQINHASEQRAALELRISEYEATGSDFEKKLSGAYFLLESLRQEQLMNSCKKEQDQAFIDTDLELRLREFDYDEVIQATDGFDENKKIGEGGVGRTFKGVVDDITVAIKVLNHDCYQKDEFLQKATNIISIKHPNLVSLIGACTDARALIYEYVPHGNLEDYLHKKSRSMSWQVRARAVSELCSVLAYLHSAQPNPVPHGNLKPSNVLFDSNYSVKLSDLHLSQKYASRRYKSTVAFTEPELLATGELVPTCDAYSLGVLLLVLLTGRRAFRIKKAVEEALDNDTLHEILDGSAGNWPVEETKELAKLAVKCCDAKRDNRPLVEEVSVVVKPLIEAAKKCNIRSWSIGSDSDSELGGAVPSYFMCPILKEIMKDPQIAADGFTYEGEAIKGWLQSGHDTSPMTNLKLPGDDLTPNHALRSAIQEWQQKRKRQSF